MPESISWLNGGKWNPTIEIFGKAIQGVMDQREGEREKNRAEPTYMPFKQQPCSV